MGCAARVLIVTRLARVIAVDVPHHVTQRGNGRRFILDCDAGRIAYLNLLRQNIELHGVGLIGYCLMSNHVHLVVTPHNADSLGLALRHTHGRYAIYWNAVHQSNGHAWQGRYFSCPSLNFAAVKSPAANPQLSLFFAVSTKGSTPTCHLVSCHLMG